MAKPIATMARKVQKITVEFGQSSRGKAFSPLISPSQEWVRISEPR